MDSRYVLHVCDERAEDISNRADFLKECASGGLDGVVAAYRTFGSVSITGPWDAELIDAQGRVCSPRKRG